MAINVTETAFENAFLTKYKPPTTLLGGMGWGLKESDALGPPPVCGFDTGWDPGTEVCCLVAQLLFLLVPGVYPLLVPKPAVKPVGVF